MENKYSILSGDQSIGTACVRRCGLYYHISCRCDLSGEVPYKVIVFGGDNKADLGICVPMENSFGLDVRIPIKRIGEGALLFRAKPKRRSCAGDFVPVIPEEPFRYLSQLGRSYLERRNDQVGVLLQSDSSKPTGQ